MMFVAIALRLGRISLLLTLLSLTTVGCNKIAEAEKGKQSEDITLSASINGILERTCNIYSENWQSLRYHYSNRDAFSKKCRNQVLGKKLVEGLWAIRSLMEDGHTDFEIIDNESPEKIHPLLLQYDSNAKQVLIAAVFDKSLDKYVGRKIKAMNGKEAMDLLFAREMLEPQSTVSSSLEVAARTLTYTLQGKPYLDFSETVDWDFEDNGTLTTQAQSLKELRERNRYILSANAYPSLWGATNISEGNGFCIGKNEIAKIISFNGKQWLWWHPRGLHFELEEIERAFSCWKTLVHEAHGIVLDLRDTAGGDFDQVYTVAYQFYVPMPSHIKRLISPGKESLEEIHDQGGPPFGLETDAGYLQELEVQTPWAAQKVTRWQGELIVITNGLCGSGCDVLAYHLQSRKNTCTYGTPTAGRLVGTSVVHPIAPDSAIHIDLYVPMRENLKPDGNRWEGQPAVPKYVGSGSIMEALGACSKKNE